MCLAIGILRLLKLLGCCLGRRQFRCDDSSLVCDPCTIDFRVMLSQRRGLCQQHFLCACEVHARCFKLCRSFCQFVTRLPFSRISSFALLTLLDLSVFKLHDEVLGSFERRLGLGVKFSAFLLQVGALVFQLFLHMMEG